MDFKSEKQELSYMLGCSGGNNVAISLSIVAKMANDPAMAAKYEKVIADIPNHGKEVKEKIESEPGCKVYASGVKIDKDGKVTYWIVGGKSGEGPGTKGSSAEDVISKMRYGEVEAVSGKMLDGITSVGFDIRA